MQRVGAWIRRRWPHLRALLVLAHVVAIIVLSLPEPGRMGERRRWQSATTQRELAEWGEILTRWGFEVTTAELEARLWALAQRYIRLRSSTDRVLLPYVEVACVGQAWGMFASPNRVPAELSVEVDDGGGFRRVYLSRSPEHRYLAERFDNNRMRKLLGYANTRPWVFDEVAEWVARHAFADHPDVTAVRVTLSRFDSLPAERVRRGERAERRVQHRRILRPSEAEP